MPWKENTPVDQRLEFINAFRAQEISFSALCRYYNIARPTGYKWLARYMDGGPEALCDLSRAPHSQPHRTPEPIESRILSLRMDHPTWGPKKLLAHLERLDSRLRWPAPSTIGELLRREGLTNPSRRRRRTPMSEQPLAHALAPNDVWCADFKGWFLCQNGQRCDPLTITDAFSRFLLRCRSVPKTDGLHVRKIFEAAFCQFGLPAIIRTDNGAPFASPGLCGLSRLSVWWIRLGIRPERIEPGSPQQNGRHERFHRTLKHETATPPARSIASQQKVFQQFQQTYNTVRPHEAIGQRPPAFLYQPSPRPYPPRLPDLSYPFEASLVRVNAAGHILRRKNAIYISTMLEGERVALRPIGDAIFEVHFGPLLLGWLEESSGSFTPNRPPPRTRKAAS